MSGISPHCERVLKDFEERTKDVCFDFREIRAVVLCFAWKEMEEKHIPFSVAVRNAWAAVKDKCLKAGAFI